MQILSNIENETDKGRAIINGFYSDISRLFNKEEDLTYDGAKPNPEDW